MATETHEVFTPASADGQGYGPEIDFETTNDDGFKDGFRIWKDRYDGAMIRLYVNVGSGDTLVVRQKFRAADDWVTVATYTSSTVASLEPSPLWIIQRTGGSSNDSKVVWAV